ncbi:MAG: D-aminoacyl-tRNA deacylase [Paludibacteraceae bacterium]
MRILVQRVAYASVTIDGNVKAQIAEGLLVFVGIEDADNQQDVEWLVNKVVNLRIFGDEHGVMNRSLLDTGGNLLIVSQFTLHASTAKGNRPSYIKAAKPEVAAPLYDSFCRMAAQKLGKPVMTGTFGADMKVELLNDGPVTIWIDSKRRE